MNVWRIAALILLAITISCLYAVYDTTQKLAECMRADAGVEVVIDDRDGTAFIRINGEHIHVFPNACRKGVRL